MAENKKGFFDTTKEILKPVGKVVKEVGKYGDIRTDFYKEGVNIEEKADDIEEQMKKIRAKKTIESADDITGSTYTEYRKSPISPLMRTVSPTHRIVHGLSQIPEMYKNFKDGKPLIAEGAPTILEKIKTGIEKFREGPTE